MFRVGFGYDAHRLSEGRPLILGGVRVPYPLGLQGHSDADVLTHAVMDALLGALCLGDIGRLFPDTDPAFKTADSLKLLAEVVNRVKEQGYRVNQVDATVVAENPRRAPHAAAIKERLSGALKVPPGRVSVKAKTSEKMGFCGREEGIEAFAVVTLIREK